MYTRGTAIPLGGWSCDALSRMYVTGWACDALKRMIVMGSMDVRGGSFCDPVQRADWWRVASGSILRGSLEDCGGNVTETKRTGQ